ncbi:ABC transporter permease [Neiella marina]|uniref:ABC transporter permease n=1 Tax=Neiella holothuriorum TaxID=2870530 RepID=A0ABS7EK86_9GAMM|nr:ABC transporter permease [Neiella holothuriorum]MBW8192705.1 ABC transporter permease [Neiella holothuriorum]
MWQLYLKELLELTRDRRVMMTMILTPLVIMPALMAIGAGATAAIASSKQQQAINYEVRGELDGYSVVAALNKQKGLQRQTLAPDLSPQEALQQGTVDIVLEVSGEMPNATWLLHYNGAEVFSRGERLVERVKADLAKSWHRKQLAQQGMTDDQQDQWLEPIKLQKQSIADERETIGEAIGGILPYIMLLVALSGAIYPAIDIGAGEKERGTLETLLMLPLTTAELVIAKIALVATTAFVAAALMLISLTGWSAAAAYGLGIEVVQEAMQSFQIVDLMLILLTVMPACVIFASLMMAISFYARSFKEAQNYMGFAFTIPFLPLLLASLPGIEMDFVWAMIPLSNVALAIKELAKGTMNWGYLVLIWLNAGFIAWVLAKLTIGWCQREQVLFR